MQKKTVSNKPKLDSMLGAVERKVPARKPATGSCLSRAYCV